MNIGRSIIILFMTGNLTLVSDDDRQPWTFLFSKVFSQEQSQENNNKKQLGFSKEQVPLFTQLIFSWNALRPEQGYFSFYACVRDHETGKWGEWHRMADWGDGVQRSYLSKEDQFSHYDFVRLELSKYRFADAFRIKITAHDGARFEGIKSLATCISNLNEFKAELFDHDCKRLSSVHIKNVPMIAQFALEHPHNDKICSPTSCSMLTGFLLQQTIDPVEFARNSYDQGLQVFGSWPFNMAHAFELCNGTHRFYTARLDSFARIHARLKKGVPVVVSVRGPLDGAELPYRNGHLLVVVGYDAKKREIIAHDPAFKTDRETEKRYSIKSFLLAWERSRRLAYIADAIS